MLDVSDLHSAYGRIEVLKGVSLQVRQGEVVALIGRASCRERVSTIV